MEAEEVGTVKAEEVGTAEAEEASTVPQDQINLAIKTKKAIKILP